MLVTPAAWQLSRRAQAWLTCNVRQNHMPKPIPALWSCLVPSKEGGALVGNRAGLRCLKEKIEAALESGSARCEEVTCDWREIRCEEEYPWAKERPKRPIRNLITLIIVATVVGTLMLIFGLGVHELISWWR